MHGCEWRPEEQTERHFRFLNAPEEREPFAASLDGSCHVALEVTGNAFEIYDLLSRHAGQVVAANPLELRRLRSGRHTDRVDAARLAKFLALGAVPAVWVPPQPVREVRRLLRYRERLVSHRRSYVNQVRAILRRHDRRLARRRDGGKAVDPEFLARLPAGERWILESALHQIERLDNEITALEDELARRVRGEPGVQLLLSIPGVGLIAAVAIWASIGDPHRFRTAKQVGRYAGLDPSVTQSGERDRRGRISKNGNAWLRTVLVEAAGVVAQWDEGALGAFYRRKAKQVGHKRAVVALARKLLIVAWRMMQRGEAYRAPREQALQRKLKELACRAGRAEGCRAARTSQPGQPATAGTSHQAAAKPGQHRPPQTVRSPATVLQRGTSVPA